MKIRIKYELCKLKQNDHLRERHSRCVHLELASSIILSISSLVIIGFHIFFHFASNSLSSSGERSVSVLSPPEVSALVQVTDLSPIRLIWTSTLEASLEESDSEIVVLVISSTYSSPKITIWWLVRSVSLTSWYVIVNFLSGDNLPCLIERLNWESVPNPRIETASSKIV